MARHRLVRNTRPQASDLRAAGTTLLLSAVLWAGAHLVHQWDRTPSWVRDGYLDKDLLTTLLQVIPAVVVAVFIFAAGTVFVIAQMIVAALGSRAVLSLVQQAAARSTVIVGMILLVASLLLATVSNVADPLDPKWSSAGLALSVATSGYVVWAMVVLVGVVGTFLDPGKYSRSLSRPVQQSRREPGSDELYERVRALRQWLRTATATSESRDITFALAGLSGLLEQYLTQTGDDTRAWRHRPPREYEESQPRDESAAVVERRGQPYLVGWFGNEYGRAVVRGLEVGMRSNLLLRRDADELLKALERAVRRCAAAGAAEEAGFLLDRIAEIGLFCLQIDGRPWDRWFDVPVQTLARLEKHLELADGEGPPPRLQVQWSKDEVDSQPGAADRHERYPLAARALAGWCLASQALEQRRGATPPGVLGADCASLLGERAREPGDRGTALWKDARALACTPQILPRWLPGVDGDGAEPGTPPSELDLAIPEYIEAVQARVRAPVSCCPAAGEPREPAFRGAAAAAAAGSVGTAALALLLGRALGVGPGRQWDTRVRRRQPPKE